MLLQPLLRILTDSDVEALRRIAPTYVQEVWFPGDSRRVGNEKGPLRSERIGPVVAGACNHPNWLVLRFSFRLVKAAA